MNKLIAFLVVAILAFPAAFAADLTGYPTYFNDVSIVIDENSDELGNAFALANALTDAGITNQIRFESEFVDVTGLQIISLGSNAVTDMLTENDDALYAPQGGEAVIKMYENDAVQIAVLGDTTKGVHVLTNWETFPIKFTQTAIQGTIPDLYLYQVITHLDYSCGGTQGFNPDGSWPQPCEEFDLVEYFDPTTPVDDGTGDDGSGDDGSDDGTGDDGTGDDGTGDDGTGDDGSDDGSGDDGTGDDGTGDDGTGDDGTGDDGTGDDSDDEVTPGASFTITSFTLGDSNQDRGETVSTTTTLENTGTVDLTGFSISGINSKYNMSISDFPSTLATGQTATVTVEATVPLNHDAVDNSCNAEALGIGTLTVNTAQNAKATTEPKMQAVNELRITDADAIVEGDKDRFEDRTVEAYWDDNVDIIVEVMNRFSDDNDKAGQDAEMEVEVEIEGDTDEIDLDSDNEDIDVDADEKEELAFSGRIEDDARGKIRLDITAKGTDENGARHCDETTGKFDVIEGFRSAIVPTGGQIEEEEINFIPFPEEEEQNTQPAVQPQDEPRQEAVEPVVQTAPVSREKFRDSNGYAWLLVGMILLMLAVLAAEIAYIMHKRKQLKEQDFYGETYETVQN